MIDNKDEILTDTERKIITGMSIYWKEVEKREDNKRILYDELANISRQLGAAKVLSIISRYVELTGDEITKLEDKIRELESQLIAEKLENLE